MQAPPVASEEIRGKLAEILQRPEFQPQQESWLQRALDWLSGWLSLELPDTGSFQIVVLYIVAVVAGALLAWVIARVMLARRGTGRAVVGAPPAAVAHTERRVSALLAEARAARARGDLSLAMRLFFFALVVGLGRAGDLEYHDAWTNRELLQRGSPSPRLARALEDLVRELDLKGFGCVPTVEDDVNRLEALCKSMLGGAS
jgi:hypothetical protein